MTGSFTQYSLCNHATRNFRQATSPFPQSSVEILCTILFHLLFRDYVDRVYQCVSAVIAVELAAFVAYVAAAAT